MLGQSFTALGGEASEPPVGAEQGDTGPARAAPRQPLAEQFRAAVIDRRQIANVDRQRLVDREVFVVVGPGLNVDRIAGLGGIDRILDVLILGACADVENRICLAPEEDDEPPVGCAQAINGLLRSNGSTVMIVRIARAVRAMFDHSAGGARWIGQGCAMPGSAVMAIQEMAWARPALSTGQQSSQRRRGTGVSARMPTEALGRERPPSACRSRRQGSAA